MFEFSKERAKKHMSKAIRHFRKSEFSKLDIQFMRAVEMGDVDLQNEIAAKKQTLRDLTDIDTGSFETRDELVNLWPSGSLGVESPFPKF